MFPSILIVDDEPSILQSLSGLLADESPGSITLKEEKGKQQIILRLDIEEIRGSDVSMMPDNLVKELGGPDIPATGFAIGFDRLSELAGLNSPDLVKKPDVFLAALGAESQALAFEWVSASRSNS